MSGDTIANGGTKTVVVPSARKVSGGEGREFGTLLRKGKVKNVYPALVFAFRDDISVFDQRIPTPIPRKGETLARCGKHFFELVERLGYNTHFIGLTAPNVMIVKRAEIEEKPRGVDKPGRFVNLEFITRYYAAGSLLDRFKNGKAKPEDFGLTHVPKPGEQLEVPIFEATTKFEETGDRPVAGQELLDIGGISKGMLDRIREMVLKIDEEIQLEVDPRGLLHVDGKKEIAVDADGNPMIVDTFASGDEDRWWDKKEWEQTDGKATELSKEFVRQYYRRTGYHAELTKAKEEHRTPPPIPGLPPEMIEQTSRLYIDIYERLTGESFN